MTVSDLRGTDIAERDDDERNSPNEDTHTLDPIPTPSGPQMHVLRELTHGDYFGEQALLREERRSANVIAITNVEVINKF